MNWTSIISDLRSEGLTQAEIGKRIGRSQVWVADLLAGRYEDISWSVGESLIKLHKKLCRDKTGFRQFKDSSDADRTQPAKRKRQAATA